MDESVWICESDHVDDVVFYDDDDVVYDDDDDVVFYDDDGDVVFHDDDDDISTPYRLQYFVFNFE